MKQVRAISGINVVPGRLILIATFVSCCLAMRLSAQTYRSQPSGSNKSWTITRESHIENARPERTVQTHLQDGDRILDNVTLEEGQSDGHFEAYEDIESETVHVSPSTVRTITRIFGRDGGGHKSLLQSMEEVTHRMPSGNSSTQRVVSVPDSDGRLHPIRREISETNKTSGDVQETKTTVMVVDGTGELVPTIKIDERQQSANNVTHFRKTRQLLDGGREWQVTEIREGTITQDGSSRVTDERVLQLGPEGKLTEVSRHVSKESAPSSGEKQSSFENYALDKPGAARDGSLHLLERVTSTESTSATGQQKIEQHVQQPQLYDAGAGLSESAFITETVRPVPSGAEGARTIHVRTGAGDFEVYAADTTKSDNVHAIDLH